MNHEKVFKVAKRDRAFMSAIRASDQKMPGFFADSLEKGIWAAGYAGWVLGYYGTKEYLRRKAEWEFL